MEREMCFICGTTISRGNRSEVNQSKMDKLVSVQRTVDHSSTIICDILSRILNETVMGEENVCRLCFNLLNDIDYHLKEAQEKTDEITAKFLDKEKDPLRYNPELKLLDPRRGSRKEKTRGGSKQQISPGLVTRNIQTELGPASVRPRSPSHVPVKGGGKGQSFFKSPERMKSPKKKHSPGKSGLGGGGGDESDDEMSEKKRRLLSRVLAPATKRGRHPSSGGEEEEERRLTIDMEEEMIRKIRKKEKKMKRREKRRRQLAELEQAGRAEEQAGRLRETVKREEKSITVPEPEHHDNSDLDNDYIQDISEPEDNTSAHAQYSSPTKAKSEDIQTVDLSQLGDLFSQEYSQQQNLASQQNSSSSQVFAKKSIPTTSSQQQVIQQQQQQQQQPVYIVQEPGVTSITLHPGQSFPIIDCRNIVTGAAVSEAVIATSQATVVVESPQLAPEVSTASDVSTPVVTKSPPSAAKTKTEAESSKKVGGAAAGVPNVPCPHCDKKFMRGYNMRVHIERVHNKSKPWQCQFCEKTFATTSDLKQHLSSHGMGKIHKCEDCGREFTNRDSAILHRKQHNNERTHWCQDCGKGFFKASCLQRHMRSHTGEKPYHCEFCNRGFSQVTTLKNHKKVCKAAEKTIGEAEFTIDDADVKPN